MRQHDIIKTGDSDVSRSIQDRNGEVVLAYCRTCQKGEGELDLNYCPGNPTGKCPICGCNVWKDDPQAVEDHDELSHRANQDFIGG